MHDDPARQARSLGILPAAVSAVKSIYDEATGEVLPEDVLAGLRGQLDQIHRLADLVPETFRKPTGLSAV